MSGKKLKMSWSENSTMILIFMVHMCSFERIGNGCTWLNILVWLELNAIESIVFIEVKHKKSKLNSYLLIQWISTLVLFMLIANGTILRLGSQVWYLDSEDDTVDLNDWKLLASNYNEILGCLVFIVFFCNIGCNV